MQLVSTSQDTSFTVPSVHFQMLAITTCELAVIRMQQLARDLLRAWSCFFGKFCRDMGFRELVEGGM